MEMYMDKLTRMVTFIVKYNRQENTGKMLISEGPMGIIPDDKYSHF